MFLTIFLVPAEEQMVSGEVRPGVEVVSLDSQHFPDVLQTVDDHAGHGSHPELDYLAVELPDKVAESFVGHVVASQDMKGAQDRPGFRAWRLGHAVVPTVEDVLFR